MSSILEYLRTQIVECVCLQEEAPEERVITVIESPVQGKDSYTISTSPRRNGQPPSSSEVTAEVLASWAWPDGFTPPTELLANAEKMKILEKVEQDINQIMLSTGVNYFERAIQGKITLDKKLIVRYLEASQWKDPLPEPWKPCGERIVETIEWRCSMPMPISDRSLLQRELATGKFFAKGLSRNGRPIVYIRIGKENTWDANGNLVGLVYTLERAISQMVGDVCETISIIDCSGVGMMNAPSSGFVKLAVEIVGKHYPRRNGQVFIVNVSSIFYMMWNLIAMTLSEVTKKKIQILTSDLNEMRSAIGQLVEESVLLKEYGGDNEDQFDPEKYMDEDPNLKI